jgi:hypothetical protein
MLILCRDIGTIALQRLENLDLTSAEIQKNMKQIESEFSKITVGVDSLVATKESMFHEAMTYNP